MEKSCARHLIRCRCVLTQFKKADNPPSYQFVVFSEIVDEQVQTKLVSCPNCGILHKVYDICKSEIINSDESRTLINIEDVKSSLQENVSSVLEKHEADISVWEHARWIIENQQWGNFVVLEQEKTPGGKNVKIMTILGTSLFRIETRFVSDGVFDGK